MNVDKFLNDYLVEHNDYEAVRKKKRNKFLLISLVIFALCIFFKPITYIKETIEYNATEARKENGNKKYDFNEYFTNFNTDNKKYLENVGNANLIYHGKYAMPIKGTVTSDYGYRTSPFNGRQEFHTGIDISGMHRDHVVTIEKGTVVFAGVQRGYGNCVLVHNFGQDEEFYTFYAHLSKIVVKEGQSLERGQVLGLEGGASTDPNPGYSTGHHLHFEVRRNESMNSHVDPKPYIF